ncbi:hypothetical protein [Agrobacterium cavarae]|uniref:hypothetical protein n=1 Tax=Agrobacterium cavarae TaxID=2528239 RepID=UPI0028969EE6|nr:hypothetical protein [Agrobacterium cavarae]
MPRNGSGVYSKPPNSTAMPDTEIRSAMFNSVIDDLVADANNPRPLSAGGTGAQNPAGARAAFELDKRLVFSVKSANYTLVKDDNNGAIAVSANATVALSTVATLGASWHALIVADGGIATIDPSGSEKINGADNIVLQNGQSALVIATGISGDEFTAIVFAGDVYSKADVEAKVAGASPVGSVIMMAGNGTNPPPGFLLMNGAPCTSAYPQLRAWLLANGATVNSNGDPIIEDMGGYFPRGWRSGQVVDSARAFGSAQADELKSHKHTPTGFITAGSISNNSGANRYYSDVIFVANNGAIPDTQASGGAETRPVNKTFTFWIRAYAGDQAAGAADLAALTNNVQALQIRTSTLEQQGTLFKSANQAYTAGALGSVAHGLSEAPTKLSAEFVCLVANNGWAVGDRIEMAPGTQPWPGIGSFGILIWADASNIYWQLGVNGVVLLSKGAGSGNFAAAFANWALRLKGAR